MENKADDLRNIDDVMRRPSSLKNLHHDSEKDVCGWEVDDDIKEFSLDFIKVLNSKLKGHENDDQNKYHLKNPKEYNSQQYGFDIDHNKPTNYDDDTDQVKIIKTNHKCGPTTSYFTNNQIQQLNQGKTSFMESYSNITQFDKKKQNPFLYTTQNNKKKPYDLTGILTNTNNKVNPLGKHQSLSTSPYKILSSNGTYQHIPNDLPKTNLFFGANFTSSTSLASSTSTALLFKNTVGTNPTETSILNRNSRVGLQTPDNLSQSKPCRLFSDSCMQIPFPSFRNQQRLFIEKNKFKQPKLWELYHLKRITQSRNSKSRQGGDGRIKLIPKDSKIDMMMNEKDMMIMMMGNNNGQTLRKKFKEINLELITRSGIGGNRSQEPTSRSKYEEQIETNSTDTQGQYSSNFIMPSANSNNEKLIELQNLQNTFETPKKFFSAEKQNSNTKSSDILLGINSEISSEIKQKTEIESEPFNPRKFSEVIHELRNRNRFQPMSKDIQSIKTKTYSLSNPKTINDEGKIPKSNLMGLSLQIPISTTNSSDKLHTRNKYMIKSNALVELNTNPWFNTETNNNPEPHNHLKKSSTTATAALSNLMTMKKKKMIIPNTYTNNTLSRFGFIKNEKYNQVVIPKNQANTNKYHAKKTRGCTLVSITPSILDAY